MHSPSTDWPAFVTGFTAGFAVCSVYVMILIRFRKAANSTGANGRPPIAGPDFTPKQ